MKHRGFVRAAVRILVTSALLTGCGTAASEVIDTPVPFDPPDILEASFEEGWDGWTDASGGEPNGHIERSTDQATDGSWSVKRMLPQGGDSDGSLWHQFDQPVLELFFRAKVRFSSFYDGGSYKTFAFWTAEPGSRQLILYITERGMTGWSPETSSLYPWGEFTIQPDRWYTVEVQFQKSANRFRAWWDGDLLRTSNADGWVEMGAGDGEGIWRFELAGLANSPSNSSSHYWDEAALSTRRIGP